MFDGQAANRIPNQRQRTIWVASLLVLGVAFLYWPVADFNFINWDDGDYVFNNSHIKTGLSWAGLRWCFQIGDASNWHPLTWMSHMLDCQLFGLKPGPPHVINVLLHAANSVLLFVALKRLTGAFWRSAMVAALFAWHPLRVESVAWVAERKDVLSALFWMLALWAYARYAEESKLRTSKLKTFYALTVVFFALGLMAKPMLVTLPCVLLLLDWWPLRRFAPGETRANRLLILEKLPFFLLTAGSCVVTMIAQNRGGAVASLEYVPLAARMSNCAASYWRYIGKLFWPADLSVLYRLNMKLPASEVIPAMAVLVVVSAIALMFWGRRPYVLVGWLWYLGVLIPVIGLVQVGAQSMADRYTYIPSIGIFIIVCWGARDLTCNLPRGALVVACAVAVVLVASASRTIGQVSYWRNSGTLFRHALAIDPDNGIARCCYGCYFRDLGQLEPARVEFQQAIKTTPDYLLGYTFLSGVLEREGRRDEAMTVLRDGLKVRPDYSDARCELARLLLAGKSYPTAETELEEGLKFDPTNPDLHFVLGQTLVARQRPSDAIAQYRAALQSLPDFADALNNLAWLLASNPDPKLRNGNEAVQLASRACELTQTNDAIKIGTLADACAEAGRFEEAVAWAQKAGEIAKARGQTNVAEQNLELKKLYQAHRAFYEYY
jgi:protein O-mannosyl-transferase